MPINTCLHININKHFHTYTHIHTYMYVNVSWVKLCLGAVNCFLFFFFVTEHSHLVPLRPLHLFGCASSLPCAKGPTYQSPVNTMLCVKTEKGILINREKKKEKNEREREKEKEKEPLYWQRKLHSLGRIQLKPWCHLFSLTWPTPQTRQKRTSRFLSSRTRIFWATHTHTHAFLVRRNY